MKVFIKKKHLINVVNKMREEQETTDESNVLVSDKYLKDITEAIRMVKGITNNIKPKDFASYLGTSLHNITFDGNGGTGGIYHIATGNTLGDLPQSEQTGEVFDGWYTADGIKITSDTVVTDDVTYYAKWEGQYWITYDGLDNVHFDIVSNPRSYYTTDNTITLNNPDPYSHVIFNGWTSSDITTPTTSMTIPTGSTGDKTFTANWNMNPLHITFQYSLDGGYLADESSDDWSVNDDGVLLYKGETDHKITNYTHTKWDNFAVWDDQIQFVNHINDLVIKKNGYYIYSYTPWVYNNGNGQLNDTSKYYPRNMNYLDRTKNTHLILSPHWMKESYSVHANNYNPYDDNNKLHYSSIHPSSTAQSYPSTFYIDSSDIRMPVIYCYGFIFKGWKNHDDDTDTPEVVKTIPTGSYGNKTFDAVWEQNDANITVEYLLDDGILDTDKSDSGYTVNENGELLYNDSKNHLMIDATNSNHAITSQWVGNTTIINMPRPDGSTSQAKICITKPGYYATRWKWIDKNVIDYSNRNLTRDYTINELQQGVHIRMKPYWEIATYTITYNKDAVIDGKTITSSIANDSQYKSYTTSYNINTADIGIPTPQARGCIFKGWKDHNIENDLPVTNRIIPTGSYGNKTFDAVYEKNTNAIITIQYTLNGGELDKANSMEGYDVVDDVILYNGSINHPFINCTNRNLPTTSQWVSENNNFYTPDPNGISSVSKICIKKEGYIASSWRLAGTLISFSSSLYFPSYITDPEKLNQGFHAILQPIWDVVNYGISYATNGGSIYGSYKTMYNIESNDITLPKPIKNGYTFLGWTGSNGNTPQIEVIIPKGSTGNKLYTANWEVNS